MTTPEPTPRAVALELLSEIAEVEISAIKGDDRLREDLGMDSLSSLELLSSLGERLRIDLQIEQAMDIRTVDDACKFVELQCQAQR